MKTTIAGNGFRKVLQNAKPYAAMIFLQLGYAGMYVISVATLKEGMNQFVLVVYRNVIAAAVIAPLALWFERERRPKVTLRIFLKILGLVVLEPVLEQNLFYMGAKSTSASFASTLENIIPAITYFMALILRVEKFDVGRRRGQMKIIGTLLTVSGLVLMILYKGPVFDLLFSSSSRDRRSDASSAEDLHSTTWLKGTFMVIGSSTCWSAFLILQSNTLESYPAELTLTVLICSMGAGFSAMVAVAANGRSSSPWVIGWDKRLVAPVYSGVICTGVAYYVQGIVMKQRGPVFASAFNPLVMIMTAILASFILKDKISLGMSGKGFHHKNMFFAAYISSYVVGWCYMHTSFGYMHTNLVTLGAILMVAGLYLMLWGKSKDHVNSSVKIQGGPELLPVAAPYPIISRDPISLEQDPK